MRSDVFKQFEEQFGDEWKCGCGSSFESDWVEVVSKTSNTLLARYSCQICGREQIFAISANSEQELIEAPSIELPNRSINSNDVLDIRKEVKKINTTQVRSVGRRKSRARLATSKITRS
jgi:hypothetical protein